MQDAIVIEIIKQLLTFGPGILNEIVSMMETKEDLTVDDIRALKIDKDPEQYFDQDPA